MQREIKFRVRNKITNKVVGYEALFPTEVDNSQHEWCSSGNGIDWQNGIIAGKNFRREQYTGLKDKNGVPIYEGDILLGQVILKIPVSAGDSTSGTSYTRNEPYGDKILFQIVYNPNIAAFAFQVIKNDGKKLPDGWQEKRQFEIIGNIWENPDLLPSTSQETK